MKKIILFGASGMVGQGVLRGCLLDPEIDTVLLINRSATDQTHEKIHEIITPNVGDLTAFESQLTGYDACLFCLGVSSFRMTEENYRRITYDLTLGAAKTLAKLNPQMTFLYVSGAHTDSTEQGTSMWAASKAPPKTSSSASHSKPPTRSAPEPSRRSTASSRKRPSTTSSAPSSHPSFRSPGSFSPTRSSPPNNSGA